mmetsp:Transcript_20666/g.26734  ORF Transcript_20666/g.26734 Transcript_20666/m.26734 type:complete len:173 (-) Transcript_20666:195-713(-)|eukprot:CAMPEP_0116069342 /NCGR_PEP_ID=MMETSP0322-20121206/12242_1 /TAXON_ID=163516 /ORGANISM="Leptocylindrus danicus var. apora, Strain B651" /LENGTH=172 /DNA_ID=CAMNT_0003556711 /DNA_START=149 /DNA_END=667 /DNA_ORIENTATION=+
MWVKGHKCLPALAFFLMILCFSMHEKSSSAEATTVKWTENSNDPYKDMDAANAPRSQKYWNEHNIERPDYALTEEEYAEKYGTKRSLTFVGNYWISVLKWVGLVGFCVLCVIPWLRQQWYLVEGTVTSYGERLGDGGSKGIFSVQTSRLSVVDTRKARLARFEKDASDDKCD